MAEMEDQTSRPRPDPTELTTAAVSLAVARAKEFTNGKMAVLEERLRGIDRATEVLHETVTRTPTDIQQAVGHLRELTEEKFRGLEGVLNEQRRGIEVAEREREKAASALRVELARSIEEGDRALRNHITSQVAEIRAALIAADLLEQERVNHVAESIHAERRITELTRELTETAILKEERSADKRFETLSAQVEGLRATVVTMTERLAAKL